MFILEKNWFSSFGNERHVGHQGRSLQVRLWVARPGPPLRWRVVSPFASHVSEGEKMRTLQMRCSWELYKWEKIQNVDICCGLLLAVVSIFACHIMSLFICAGAFGKVGWARRWGSMLFLHKINEWPKDTPKCNRIVQVSKCCKGSHFYTEEVKLSLHNFGGRKTCDF